MVRARRRVARLALIRACLLLMLVALPSALGVPGAAVYAHDGDHPTDDELLAQVAFDQRLDSQMPVDVAVIDEQGRSTVLGQYLGQKPAIMVFTYYDCPNLCPIILHGLTESLRTMRVDVGSDYEVIVASIDPRETPEQSTAAKAAILASYGRWGTQDGWHFLTAPERSISELASAAGFHYAYDEDTDQYAHPSGILVLTPAGRISKYLYGLEFSPRDLRLALVDASEGKVGSFVDQLLLACFHYDPTRGRYSLAIKSVLKYSAVATSLAMGALVIVLNRKWRKVGQEDPKP